MSGTKKRAISLTDAILGGRFGIMPSTPEEEVGGVAPPNLPPSRQGDRNDPFGGKYRGPIWNPKPKKKKPQNFAR